MLARLSQVMREAHSVSNRYRFLDEQKFRYFCEGLILDAKDMEVLDGALQGLDQHNKLPSQIIQHSQHHGFGPGLQARGSQIIVTLEKRGKGDGKIIPIATAGQHHEIRGLPPALHIMLRSPTLDTLQRVEIPLRYALKGLPNPKVAQLWQDDEYAARIICAGPGRLTHEQVLKIRAAATSGMSPARIGEVVGARNLSQVERVLAGETYTRVR